MNNDYHKQLLSQRDFLQKMLEKTPTTAVLARMSDEAQLRKVQEKLDKLGIIAKAPAIENHL